MRPSQSSWKLFRMGGFEEVGRAANGPSSEKEVSNQPCMWGKTYWVIKGDVYHDARVLSYKLLKADKL